MVGSAGEPAVGSPVAEPSAGSCASRSGPAAVGSVVGSSLGSCGPVTSAHELRHGGEPAVADPLELELHPVGVHAPVRGRRCCARCCRRPRGRWRCCSSARTRPASTTLPSDDLVLGEQVLEAGRSWPRTRSSKSPVAPSSTRSTSLSKSSVVDRGEVQRRLPGGAQGVLARVVLVRVAAAAGRRARPPRRRAAGRQHGQHDEQPPRAPRVRRGRRRCQRAPEAAGRPSPRQRAEQQPLPRVLAEDARRRRCWSRSTGAGRPR